MKKNDLVKGKRQKICLLFEKFVIYSFFIMTIVELIFLVNLLSFYRIKSNQYFYNLLEKRLVVKRFIGQFDTIPKKIFFKNGNKCTSKMQTPRNIFDVDTFSGFDLTNITESVMIADYHKNSKTGVINNSNSKFNYYEIDIGKKNNTQIKLETKYQYMNWKTFFLCAFRIEIVSTESIIFLPKEKNCTEIGGYVAECGIYFETYKICINAELVKVKSQFANLLLDQKKIKLDDLCPFNYISFDFDSMKNNPEIPVEKFSTKVKKNQPPIDKQNLTNLNILMNTDSVKFGNYIKINSPEDQIIFDDRPDFNVIYNTPIGYDDSISDDLDTYSFAEFYNDTFFNSSVKNKINNKTCYEPIFMTGSSGKEFYKITDSSLSKINITYPLYNFRAISEKCFNNILNKDGEYKYNFFKLVSDNSTSFLNRTFYYMFAWIITKLILSFYWDVKIRMFYIKNLLNNSLNEADQNAEYITKITGKAFIGGIYGILIFGTIYHKISFLKIIKNSNDLYDNSCFPDELINKSLKMYIDYVTQMDKSNFNLFIMFFISGGMQGFLLVYYILDFIWVKAQEKLFKNLNRLENQNNDEDNLLVKKEN